MAGQVKRELMDALMSWGSDEEEGADNNGQSEDDETESEPERPGKRDADIVADSDSDSDSDSASDAAEDLDATSSDDDGDEEEKPIKVKAERGTSGRGRKKRVGDEEAKGFDLNDGGNIDFLDDDDDDDDDDGDGDDDEEDNETEDEEHGEDVDEMPVLRQVNSADFEQQARYEAEEEEIVVKEEQGLRSLFGDDEDDDDEDEDGIGGISQRNAINTGSQGESADEGEENAADSKHLSFTDELMSNDTGSVVDDTGEEVTTSLRIDARERLEAKSLLSSIIANVSIRENKVLKRGDTLDGPPIEDPIAHIDEFKRFSQDPLEIFNDYELKLKKPTTPERPDPRVRPSQHHPRRALSAFAKAPRPLVEAVAATVQHQQQLLSRKRKRSQTAEPTCEDVSADVLATVARIGERFTDCFLESLISDNAAALQGNNDGYSQRSWIPLPVTRKPVANWRFVLENMLKNSVSGNGLGGDSVCPPLRKETLQRIRDRLKTLNTLPWKNDDAELLNKVDHLVDKSAATSAQAQAPAPLPVVDLRSEMATDGDIVML